MKYAQMQIHLSHRKSHYKDMQKKDRKTRRHPRWITAAISEKLGCTTGAILLILDKERGKRQTPLQKNVWKLYEKFMSISLED